MEVTMLVLVEVEVTVVDLVISLMDFLVSSAVSSFFGGGMSGNFGLPVIVLVVVVETILASSSSILPHSSFSVSASFWISSIDFYKALDSFSSLSFSPFALALSRVSVMTFMAAVCFLISAAILSDSFLQSLD
jgi:hypothetical protein